MDGTTRYGTRTQGFLHPELETMPREQLAALQLRRLREMLENLYANVPPVRKRMLDAGMRPADVRTLDDVAALPSARRRTCATTIPTACSRGRWSSWRDCTQARAPPASPPSSATRGTTWRTGRT